MHKREAARCSLDQAFVPFPPLGSTGGDDQMHRHGIDQLVGKMHAGKWLHPFERRRPFRRPGKLTQHSLLALS